MRRALFALPLLAAFGVAPGAFAAGAATNTGVAVGTFHHVEGSSFYDAYERYQHMRFTGRFVIGGHGYQVTAQASLIEYHAPICEGPTCYPGALTGPVSLAGTSPSGAFTATCESGRSTDGPLGAQDLRSLHCDARVGSAGGPLDFAFWPQQFTVDSALPVPYAGYVTDAS